MFFVYHKFHFWAFYKKDGLIKAIKENTFPLDVQVYTLYGNVMQTKKMDIDLEKMSSRI
jgi:hypothetical protein